MTRQFVAARAAIFPTTSCRLRLVAAPQFND
jgi:hypothetical protein